MSTSSQGSVLARLAAPVVGAFLGFFPGAALASLVFANGFESRETMCADSPWPNLCTIGVAAAPGESCVLDADCAILNCTEGACGPAAGACLTADNTCAFNAECRSGSCVDGVCLADSGCEVIGEGCTSDAECCGALCATDAGESCQLGNNCRCGPGNFCRSEGDVCFASSDCCNGSCDGGRCAMHRWMQGQRRAVRERTGVLLGSVQRRDRRRRAELPARFWMPAFRRNLQRRGRMLSNSCSVFDFTTGAARCD